MEFKVVELSASTRTASEVAEIIGCEVAQIVKSLLFCTKQSSKPILILASGVNRVNEGILASEIGEEIIKADADYTREITGFAIGGVPPNAVFSLYSKDSEVLTKGKILAIK